MGTSSKTKLKPPTKIYTVEGNHQFPIDMLRYDRATPKSERDSGEIERSFRRGEKGPFKVELKAENCTHDRWYSFGWEVQI